MATNRRPSHAVWLGDFNHHHLLWDKPHNNHLFTKNNLDKTQLLIDLLAHYNMKMALPPLLPTLKSHSTRNLTRIDNVFCSENLLDLITKCYVNAKNRTVKTDHFPITTVINMVIPKVNMESWCNLKEALCAKLVGHIQTKLETLPRPATISTIQELEDKIVTLNNSVREAIEKHAPIVKISSYTKHWWTKNLFQIRSEMKWLGVRLDRQKHNFTHPIHEDYKKYRNSYAEAIRTAKATHWANWLSKIDNTDIWKASKLVTRPPTDADPGYPH